MNSTHAPVRVGLIASTALALAVSTALPVIVHLLPAGAQGPIGPRLLPIFFAPLIAVLLGRPLAGLIVALLAPVTNHLLTGAPAQAMLPTLTLQLLLFTSMVALLRRPAWPLLVLLTPLVYLGAVQLAPHVIDWLNSWVNLPVIPALALDDLLNLTWPGLLVMTLISWALTQFRR